MKRKLIKQGVGLTVYLPKKWVDRNKLEKGDSVEITEKGNKITITNDKVSFEKPAIIDIGDMDRNAFIKTVTAHYEEGCYEVIISKEKDKIYDPWKDKKRPIKEEIEFLTNRLIGFEIISMDKDKVVIRDLTRTSSKEFDNILRRIFLLNLEYQNTIKESIENNTKTENNEDYHDNITKLISLCTRLLNLSTEKSVNHKINLHTILTLLDKITDQLRYLARHSSKQKITGNKEIIYDLMQYFRDFYETFYKYDVKGINKLDIERRKIKELALKNKDPIITEFTNLLEYVQALIKPMVSLN